MAALISIVLFTISSLLRRFNFHLVLWVAGIIHPIIKYHDLYEDIHSIGVVFSVSVGLLTLGCLVSFGISKLIKFKK
jgi:hypothetical protein